MFIFHPIHLVAIHGIRHPAESASNIMQTLRAYKMLLCEAAHLKHIKQLAPQEVELFLTSSSTFWVHRQGSNTTHVELHLQNLTQTKLTAC